MPNNLSSGRIARLFGIMLLPMALGLLPACIPQKNLLLMQYDQVIDSTYAHTFEGTSFE